MAEIDTIHNAPPPAHRVHRDYRFIERHGWYPSWYPHWDPHWRAYWRQLYHYYGGDRHPLEAERMRDGFLRDYFRHMGRGRRR